MSPVKQGASYQLQSFDVQDNTNKKVRVNLWGADCQQNIPDAGTSVIVENVVTTIFQDNIILTATPETTFLVRYFSNCEIHEATLYHYTLFRTTLESTITKKHHNTTIFPI